MNDHTTKYALDIRSLAVFGSLREDPVVGGLCELFERLASYGCKGNENSVREVGELVELYSGVISGLYPVNPDLAEYVRRAVLADDNFYVEAVACDGPISDEISAAVKRELLLLRDIAGITSGQVKTPIEDMVSKIAGCCDTSVAGNTGVPGSDLVDTIRSLPEWSNGSIDLLGDFMDKLNDLGSTGYGIFAEYDFFRIAGDDIVPVPYPDAQSLSELFGYERQKEQIIKNTEALLASDRTSSSTASNMLLYGDAGTGKSSTIKAVAFGYARKGLRLIEVKKDQLHLIPKVLDAISRQPLKFILFVDDLSFSGNDDNFSALKATLEGSITGRGNNAVIYATSNRRHMIRESFSDRDGDELHVNDTLQETMSLAARFGLTVMFENPDRDEYLDIVSELAKLNGIDMPEDELFKKAEAHAIRRNGRSPRTARQFVELLKSDLIR